MVLIGDVAKGMIAVLLGKVFGDSIWIFVLCGIFALLGHIYYNSQVFWWKGVATTLGVLLIMLPGIALIMLFIWVIILAVSKYVSLASIASAVVLPFIVLIFFGLSPYLLFCLFATALCLYKHKSNIQRLLRGEEYKIGQRVG